MKDFSYGQLKSGGTHVITVGGRRSEPSARSVGVRQRAVEVVRWAVASLLVGGF
jgi:hypothetical protein